MAKEQTQDEQYSSAAWVDMTDYHSPHAQSPAQEYNGFGYMASAHGLPLDSTYQRSMPLAYTAHQPQQPLITAQWPSMITNPSNVPAQPAPTPPTLAPIHTFAAAHSLPPLTTPVPQSTARRTLTDQDRRRMCIYHDENPTVKQTEIGGMILL